MVKGKNIGLALLGIGIIGLIIYAIIQGYMEIIQAEDYIIGSLIGIIIIGFLTILISVIREQRKDTSKTMEKINKEDLRP